MITLEDKFAIHELLARFAHCSDYGDWAGLERLYVPEVVAEIEHLPLKYEGVAAQIEHAKESDHQTGGKNRHYHLNIYIEEEGDAVIAHYSFLNINAGTTPMAPKLVVTGRMRDTVVKRPDGLRTAEQYSTTVAAG